jgi:hypothetical protein
MGERMKTIQSQQGDLKIPLVGYCFYAFAAMGKRMPEQSDGHPFK